MQTTLLIVILITTPILSSKILHIAPINASSHHMWNTVLATELAKKGHEITFIAGYRPKTPLHPNIKLYVHQQTEEVIEAWSAFFYVSFFGTPYNKNKALDDTLIIDCELLFQNTPYKELIDPRNNDTYDLLLMEHTGHDCLLALSHRFSSPPVITLNPLTNNPHWLLRSAGVPLFHMSPHIADDVEPPRNFWQRIKSFIVYLRNDFYYFTHVRPAMDKIIQKYFGPDVLSVKKLFEKVSLSLINIPDWMNKIPLPANIIPVGGLHLTEPKQLNPELQKYMEEAEHGVILISFGTCIPTKDLAEDKFRSMASALGKLPQRVLWKWDSQMKDDNITFPQNIWRLPWIPQNDILGHPKTRLFVSHCGGQSSLEAMYHGVPVLGVPGFWDQNGNADGLVAEQAALKLKFMNITENLFLETVKELIGNSRYTEGASRLKTVLRDQPVKPLDRAIFWIEFVIRNKGAPHLKPLLHDLPHQHLLMFDIALLSVASVIFLVLFFKCLRIVFRVAKSVFLPKITAKNKSD